MKIRLPLFVAITFCLTWVACDVVQAPYEQKLFWSIIMSFGVAFMNNAHGIIWKVLIKR